MAEGHLKPLDVWHQWSAEIEWWWAHLGGYIEHSRVNDQLAVYMMNFESLATEMRRLDVQVVGKPWVDATTLAEKIDGLTARLQRQHDATHGIMPRRKVARTGAPTAQG